MHQCTGDGRSLLLAAGKGRGPLHGLLRQAHRVQGHERFEFFFGREPAEQTSVQGDVGQQPRHHVGQHIHAAHQIELLEDDADVRAQLTHIRAQLARLLQALAPQLDFAVNTIQPFQPAQASQQGRFARTRGTQQAHTLALVDAHIDGLKGLPVLLEGFAGIDDADGQLFI